MVDHEARSIDLQRGPANKQVEDPIPWESDVQYVKGVGPKRAYCLRKLGVNTFEDLLYFVPWRYEDRGNLKKISEVTAGEDLTLSVQVHSTRVHFTPRKRFQIFELMARDETGWLLVKWFNQSYLEKVLKKGQRLMLSGSVRANPYHGRAEMENPQYEILGQEPLQNRFSSGDELLHTGRIVPIYHETNGLTSRVIRSLIKSLLDTWSEYIPEVLPQEILDRHRLPRLGPALQQVHFPDRTEQLEVLNRGVTEFHHRLVFDDFFLLQLGLAYKRREVEEEKEGIAFATHGKGVDRFLRQLPFGLTGAQRRVIEEIREDMGRPRPMNRLVQGDVGCGKTLVALMALLIAIENGYQGVFMAPTEILAEQHYLTVMRLFSELGLNVALLTRGLGKKERVAVGRQIEIGEVHLAVGTHALIQEGVRFKRLGMVIIDEQHKFGVLQRRDLVKKGYHPDVLIMTATPIPRTLALSVYGDMDVSIIDELPPGRSPIETILLDSSKRAGAYEILSRELSAGHQAYVVYPLVEESEKTDLKAAIQMSKNLKENIFCSWRVGLLHGKMRTEEKEKVMSQFKDHQIDLLVATSVIEVGIDIPNATVILVEYAERFGLAQLHQLRGRVGRGQQRSICILMAGTGLTEEARRRLEVLVRSQDGFAIAEQDLIFRGPGEFFGTRQSGLPELKVANLVRDVKVLELARREAFGLLERDPMLHQPEHGLLRSVLHRRWKGKLDLRDIH
ncbi:MAG TPA: ATP-dependent DNA helicase RecG [Nitrospiria bacterium]|nr:ATP-dependent DNA helicase RecG [Nitrospiria bacterium]